MTPRPTARRSAALRGTLQILAAIFLFAAVTRLSVDVDLRQGSFGLEMFLLVAAATMARRFGIPLPGKGFASFLLAVVWIALFMRGWTFAVIVALLGTGLGDFVFRQLRMRNVMNNMAHITFGTGLVGVGYTLAGGALGAESLAAANLGPLAGALVGLTVVVNGTFYLDILAASGTAGLSNRLTFRWEAIISLSTAGIALGWVALVTSDPGLGAAAFWGAGLVAGTVMLLFLARQTVAADELRFIQGLAGAVAADVSIERSFTRIKELTARIVPWEHMGFARYDAERDEMVLIADTSTDEPLRFPASSGLTGEAAQTGQPVVSNHLTGKEIVLPDGETPGSEVLIPLFHGDDLVGLWSVRHGDGTMYRPADAALMNHLAPHLALSLTLSNLIRPMQNTSERAGDFGRQVEASGDAVARFAGKVAASSRQAEDEAKRAVGRVEHAVSAVTDLSSAIEEMVAAATHAEDRTGAVARDANELRDTSAQSVGQLKQLINIIERGSHEVSRLREAAGEVESFSEAIGGIANQTNLLALNATIEAARAGIHGKGFGVVAEEVRKLADEAGRAARNIGRSAQSTRKVIDGAARLLDDLQQQLTDLASVSEGWGTKLSEIVGTAGEAKTAGERVGKLPQQNLSLAQNLTRILADALKAAEASAEVAAVLASSSGEQLEAVGDLSKGAAELSALANDLEAGANFVAGDGGNGVTG